MKQSPPTDHTVIIVITVCLTTLTIALLSPGVFPVLVDLVRSMRV